MKFANGEIYSGFWSHNSKGGQGKYLYIDQTTYEGEWLNDEKDGFGIT